MGKTAVFGGSFDPVHKAHTRLAEEAVAAFNLSRVIFVPAFMPPHKEKQYADVGDRIAMLKIAVKNIKNAEISFYEAEQRKVVYSYQTLDYFKTLYPHDEILMIIGADSFNELESWKNIDYLAANYGFIVAKRPNVAANIKKKYYDRCVFMNNDLIDASSTNIRELLKSGDGKAASCLDKDVDRYIKENGLYK
jgi:nicotinate (nicotinamide) nucleotide adenylyltransferase